MTCDLQTDDASAASIDPERGETVPFKLQPPSTRPHMVGRSTLVQNWYSATNPHLVKIGGSESLATQKVGHQIFFPAVSSFYGKVSLELRWRGG